MNLDLLLGRRPVVPFGPGARIPWNEPAFSARMLREHLSQDHDRASRRLEIIDRQVAWTHQVLLGGSPGRVLDLGCGPGLYTSRLAALGHSCVGIDFSPASIEYAADQASREGLACEYRHEDLRDADLGREFDAVLMWFGEFNTFAPEEAGSLLEKIRAALAPTGKALLELHDEEYVQALGEEPPFWFAQGAGLFADEPHLVLRESQWHPEEAATTERYFVFRSSGDPEVHAQSTQSYADEPFEALLAGAGLAVASRYESLTGDEEAEADLHGVVLSTVP